MNKQDTNNESILEDLAASNATEIKGGPNPKTKRTIVLQSSVEGGVAEVQTITVSGAASNHNETVVVDEAEEDVAETARLIDLTISEEQGGEIKGGPTPQSKRTVVLIQHNETIAADDVEEDAAATARLTDLTVSEVQSDEVKGGMLLPAVQKVREAAARIGSSGMSAGKVSYSDLS